MQTSLCRSANLACAARPAKAAGAARMAAPRRSSSSSLVVRAEGESAPAKWSPPALDANTPSPTFGGSTGGLLRKAQVEEFYVLTWENPGAEVPFEMPTGGTAIMRAGANLLKLARKEQALALLTQLKAKNKVKVGNIYRLLPSGETQHLHPKDGTVPERVNAGRAPVNANMRRIGDNKEPAQIKFTGKLGAFDL